MTMAANVIDDQERERRLPEAQCLWCTVPLPATLHINGSSAALPAGSAAVAP
jgi:hypothetical protein